MIKEVISWIKNRFKQKPKTGTIVKKLELEKMEKEVTEALEEAGYIVMNLKDFSKKITPKNIAICHNDPHKKKENN